MVGFQLNVRVYQAALLQGQEVSTILAGEVLFSILKRDTYGSAYKAIRLW